MDNLITAKLLKEMIAAGVVRECQLIGTSDGFALVAKVGMAERTLRPAHGGPRPRLFKDGGKALKYIRNDLGLPPVTVELANAVFD